MKVRTFVWLTRDNRVDMRLRVAAFDNGRIAWADWLDVKALQRLGWSQGLRMVDCGANCESRGHWTWRSGG